MRLTKKATSKNGFIILALITVMMVSLSFLAYRYVNRYIEERCEEVVTSVDVSLDVNSNYIYDAISDLKALIVFDKYFIFWNEDDNLQKNYQLLGRIYGSIEDHENALKAFENSQRVLDHNKHHDRNEYLELEYQIGLSYQALNEDAMAKKYFQDAVEGYQEWFRDSPEDFDEKANREIFLRAYCFLGIKQYLEGDYTSAFNTLGLCHNSILELAQWNFASYRYKSAEPMMLLLSSDYAAKSADKLGNEEQKKYFERKHEIYSYLIDYKEKNLQDLYDLIM